MEGWRGLRHSKQCRDVRPGYGSIIPMLTPTLLQWGLCL